MHKQDSMKAIKKPEISKDKPRSNGSIEKHDPIQLPPSFKDPIYGKVGVVKTLDISILLHFGECF